MMTRFVDPNVASRPKKVKIPEEVWKEHRSFIENHIRNGASPETVSRIIRQKKMSNFAPTGGQIRHRLKTKWHSIEWSQHGRSPKPPLNSTQAAPGTGIPLQIDVDHRAVCTNPLFADNQFPADITPRFSISEQRGEPLPPPDSFQQSPAFASLAMDLGNHQSLQLSHVVEPFNAFQDYQMSELSLDYPVAELSIDSAMSDFSFDSLTSELPFDYLPSGLPFDYLPSGLSFAWSGPNSLLKQNIFPGSLKPVSYHLSESQVLPGSKKLDENDMLQRIIFRLDNNLHKTNEEARKVCLEYAKLITPKALVSVRLEFDSPGRAETAEKLFSLALEAKNRRIISSIIRRMINLPMNLIEASFVFAIWNQDLDLVRCLLGSHINLKKRDPCSVYSNLSTIRTDVGSERHSSVVLAAWRRNTELVQLLIKAGASVSTVCTKDGSERAIYPLQVALKSNERPTRLTKDNEDELFSIEELGTLGVVQALVDEGSADVNCDVGVAPICLAAFRRYPSVVRFLLSRGAEVRGGSAGQHALRWHCGLLDAGYQPFHKMATHGPKPNTSIARMLIEAGVNVQDYCKKSILKFALAKDSPEFVKILHEAGTVATEETLRYGMAKKRMRLVHYILDHMIVKLKDPSTTLDLAVRNGMKDAVPKLIDIARKNGFNLKLKHNGNWETALERFECEVKDLLNGRYRLPAKDIWKYINRLSQQLPGSRLLPRLLVLAIDGSDPDVDKPNYRDIGDQALSVAITAGDFECACRLLEYGVLGYQRAINAALKMKHYELLTNLLRVLEISSKIGTDVKTLCPSVIPLEIPLRLQKLVVTEFQPIEPNFDKHSADSCFGWHHVDDESKKVEPGDFPYTFRYPFLSSSHSVCRARRPIYRNTANWDFRLGPGTSPFWLDDAVTRAVEGYPSTLLAMLFDSYKLRYGACNGGFGSRALRRAIFDKELQSGLAVGQWLLGAGVDPISLLPHRCGKDSAFSETIDNLHTAEQPQWLSMMLNSIPDKNAIIKMRMAERETDFHEGGDCVFYTPLLTAIESKSLSAVELILDAGANINLPATPQTRRTPLQAAIESESPEIVDLLLARGAEVNAPAAKYKGRTALQLAAERGDPNMVMELLRRRADTNAPGARVYGRTALEGAAEQGRLKVLECLFVCGGVKIDGEGETQYQRALKFAETNGHRKVKDYLLQMAKENAKGRISAAELPLRGKPDWRYHG